eukprot:TRINITY_DN1494_c0_g1_i1.p1 TRINITY_DN1494_c0_g1~~TRINITY_DN1494_c0_g1_i1.p1  ORF type:complete len:634 (+),score=116.28 TRINITY_DN1494_c0_g1_i1:234-1904(+)
MAPPPPPQDGPRELQAPFEPAHGNPVPPPPADELPPPDKEVVVAAEVTVNSVKEVPASDTTQDKSAKPDPASESGIPSDPPPEDSDEDIDEWEGDDDPGFIRIPPRDNLEPELWSPEHRRPSFAMGVGISVKDHQTYVREQLRREHQRLQGEVRAYEEGTEAANNPQKTEEQPTPCSEPLEQSSPSSKETDNVSLPGDDDQKKHPPVPQLEKFNLQVIYEKNKTGFEENQEFPIQRGNIIAGRYQILEYIGGAAFSHAVQCLDLKTQLLVCVKIIKNSKDFFDQSLDEIKILQYLNRSGDADENCVLQLYDYFYHKEHLFLVTELLRDNLYEFSKYNRQSEGPLYFTVQRLQKITKQVLVALAFIHKLNLIHCDLKPENMLIRSFSRCEVKVIDFGSSCFTHDHQTSYLQSRCYRAPEVILGLPYGQGIDLWSLGAILPELLTGHVLFYNDSVNTMLCRIAAICGPFPASMVKNARHAHKFVTRSGVFYEVGKHGVDLLYPRRTSLKKRMGEGTDPLFVDFVSQLLQVDPSKRPTALEALQHPWLQQDYGPIPPPS